MDRTQATETTLATRAPGQGPRVAFIRARWHADVVDQAREGFLLELARLTNGAAQVETFDVPGAFEIPLLAKKLAQSGRFEAVVGAAFVVDGGIYRHEFVAQAVVSGLMQVGLETGVPALSVSLTPQAYQETEAHDAFFSNHFVGKGEEAARAVVGTLDAHARAAA